MIAINLKFDRRHQNLLFLNTKHLGYGKLGDMGYNHFLDSIPDFGHAPGRIHDFKKSGRGVRVTVEYICTLAHNLFLLFMKFEDPPKSRGGPPVSTPVPHHRQLQ